MKHFISYLDNGQIVKTGVCSDEDLILQGNNVIEGIADDSTQYIVNGYIVSLPLKPNQYCAFNYITYQWVDLRTPETQWPIVRSERNIKLQNSDWTDTASAPERLGQELYNQWQTYRQALRDVTNQSDPFDITWPTPP